MPLLPKKSALKNLHPRARVQVTRKKPRGAWTAAARITLRGPGKWTTRFRKEVAAWLRDQARFLTAHGDELTEGNYTARYSVPATDKPRARKTKAPRGRKQTGKK